MLATGCMALDDSTEGRDADTGPIADVDAGTVPGQDAAPPQPSAPAPLPLDDSANYTDSGEARGDGGRDLSACYDTPYDPDADCSDPRCGALASCCPGRAACCGDYAPGPRLSAEQLEGCVDLESCLGASTLFGAPSPFVVGPTLALGGDTHYDSGVLFQEVYDLRHERVRIAARFELPVDCDGCFESAAFGVTTQATLGAFDHVDALAALVLSGARSEVRLVVAGVVVARWDASEGPWALELAPTGALTVARADEILLEGARFAPAARAHVVLYGHSRNPGATDSQGARIASLETGAARCDMPSAWSAPTTLRFERGPEIWQAFDPRDPALALDAEGVPTLVFADEGALFAAKAPDPGRRDRFVPRAPGGFDDTPLLAGDHPFTSPSLTRRAGDAGFWLHALRHEEGGPRPVRVAIDEDALAPAGDVETLRLTPTPRTPLVGLAVTWVGPVGRWVLVATDVAGRATAYASHDGLGFERWSDLPTEGLHVDAVGVPRLTVERATYRVRVDTRRGTRWQVALFVSDDLLHWRLIDDESVTGVDSTERVGARAVASVRDGDRELIVYEALDGVLTRLRTRSRPLQ
ncbi:MAG: hypothetical protein KF901_07775 [Myxococcales bacterium]|nr:hypothetical protein [Myxococcales bacterium]